MNQGLIPRRYAKALFELASERGADKDVYAAMLRLASAFSAEPELQKAISNPHVASADKVKLIEAAAAPEAKAKSIVADMAKLLAVNVRMEFAHAIALAYAQEYRKARMIYSVEIASAAVLQSAELKRIHSLVDAHLPKGATAEYSEVVNPNLIGGFTVSIDNELLDASVANELKQLRLKLLSH